MGWVQADAPYIAVHATLAGFQVGMYEGRTMAKNTIFVVFFGG